MAFRFTRSPPTQGLTTATILAAALLAGSLPATADLWRSLVTTTPEWVLVVVVPWSLHLVLFWTVSIAFHVVDTYDRPGFIARYRIQTGPPRRPPMRRVLQVLAVNQALWAPLMLLVIWGSLRLRGWSPSPELPGLGTFLLELGGLSVASVIYFYASHRFLHRPWWMRRVHRVHHEFRTTTAMASEYAHPFEFTVANFGTLGAGVVLLAPSLAAIYLYTVLAVLTVLVHHCGYALPWVSWPVHHDWHHYRYKECFGTLGVLDRLLGTDEEFRTLRDGDVR